MTVQLLYPSRADRTPEGGALLDRRPAPHRTRRTWSRGGALRATERSTRLDSTGSAGTVRARARSLNCCHLYTLRSVVVAPEPDGVV